MATHEHRKVDVGSNNPTEKSTTVRALRYQLETRRPIVCLAFVVPLLMFYETAVIFTDQQGARSGLDEWLHLLLNSIGIGQLVILPLVTIAILLAWHHRLNDCWRISPIVLLGMVAESVGLGLILFFGAHAIDQAQDIETVQRLAIECHNLNAGMWAKTIAYIGTGVYEELVFRLILLSALIELGRRTLGSIHAVQVASILITSLLFALLHYDFCNPAGPAFDVNGFVFRFLASLIFCVLFLFRGFGVAVGTHAIYDVLTQI